MRVRETKYQRPKDILASVQWNGGFPAAYTARKLLPADMPDEACKTHAEIIDLYMSLAEAWWNRFKDYLEGLPDGDD